MVHAITYNPLCILTTVTLDHSAVTFTLDTIPTHATTVGFVNSMAALMASLPVMCDQH